MPRILNEGEKRGRRAQRLYAGSLATEKRRQLRRPGMKIKENFYVDFGWGLGGALLGLTSCVTM